MSVTVGGVDIVDSAIDELSSAYDVLKGQADDCGMLDMSATDIVDLIVEKLEVSNHRAQNLVKVLKKHKFVVFDNRDRCHYVLLYSDGIQRYQAIELISSDELLRYVG